MAQTTNDEVLVEWRVPRNETFEVSYLPCKLALTQIINNALRFANKQVIITVRQNASELEMVIFDDGPGFTVDSAELATTPFYRGSENPINGSSHSGLGLSITEECCHAMGGRILIYPAGTYQTLQGYHQGGCVVIKLAKDV
jgi:signal transduction histidine kinase